jgi:hypothetical protein
MELAYSQDPLLSIDDMCQNPVKALTKLAASNLLQFATKPH